ncbi:unnamed protein product [Schistosoma curassoni]|uniref:Uncharacterized protein n=1 Tax=Schistosoma curassoni TaxID=6186 RepID=A0A183JJW8_9TREM|nr:unnamed protein product [Schistosoma curassoni]
MDSESIKSCEFIIKANLPVWSQAIEVMAVGWANILITYDFSEGTHIDTTPSLCPVQITPLEGF